MEFLQRKGIPERVRERCRQQLQIQFGLKVEQRDERRRDILKIPLYRADHPRSGCAVVAERHFVRQVYDTLVRYDAGTDRLKPHLARPMRGKRIRSILHGPITCAREFAFTTGEGCRRRKDAGWIRKRAKEVGVRIKPVPVPLDWLYREEPIFF